ncbi:hypothetical protein BBP40_001629 [Aspergillus hancockii]|nr:hypothetical protein BBP40_001629 [Aspergillus hancockii]
MAFMTSELHALQQATGKNAPEAIKQSAVDAKEELKQTFDPNKAIKVGDQLPSFRLKDTIGVEQNSTELLKQGFFTFTFYRGEGEWCPFCNITVTGLQKYHARFKAKGANIVTITPNFPTLL